MSKHDAALTPLDGEGADPLSEQTRGEGAFRLDALSPGAAPGDALSAPRRSRLTNPTVFLTLLVAAGAGVVLGMRQIGIGPMSALSQVKTPDYDATQTPSKNNDHERILKALESDAAEAQVPPDQVQKNPFRIADVLGGGSGAPEDPGAASAERLRRDSELRRQKMESALAGLTINGIIGGSRPMARVSGQTVRVGDTVAELFRVTAIHGRSIELEAEGRTFVLSLDDEERPGAKPGKR